MMKKKYIAMALAIVLALSLFACGAKKIDQAKETNEKAPVTETTVPEIKADTKQDDKAVDKSADQSKAEDKKTDKAEQSTEQKTDSKPADKSSSSQSSGNSSSGSSSASSSSGNTSSSGSQPSKPTHTHSYSSKTVAPTCSADGYTTHTCSCGDSYTDSYRSALGHAWEAQYRNVTVDDYETKCVWYCSACNADVTDLLTSGADMKQHRKETGCSSGEYYNDYEYVKVGSHTEQELTGYTCTRCGASK